MTVYEKSTREQAEAELKKQNVGYTLAQVAAMIEDGTVAALLPPVENGFCGWCRAYGLTRESCDPSITALCGECESLGLAMMKAIHDDDAAAYADLQRKLNARQGMANEFVH
jgi:hypothetical protein